MTDIYLLAAYRTTVAETVVRDLEAAGMTVYFPKRDTNQQRFYVDNTNGIEGAKLIVALSEYCGLDFAFELGYARALRKPVVSYATVSVLDGMCRVDDHYTEWPDLMWAVKKHLELLKP